MKKLILFHYHLSQQNFVWFPFLFLKQKKGTLMEVKKTILLAFCFALYGSAFFLLKDFLLAQKSPELLYFFHYFKWSLAVFLVWFNLVTRPLWNQAVKILRN
jgi:hypothetical protein